MDVCVPCSLVPPVPFPLRQTHPTARLAFPCDRILYCVAGFRQESTPLEKEPKGVPKASTAATAAGFSEPEKPPTQQSLAQSWFGTASVPASKPKGFGEDVTTPLASGGGSAGVGDSGGGYGRIGGGADDDDNPFRSSGAGAADVNPVA